MNAQKIYILGGYQSDFAQNIIRANQAVSDLFVDTVRSGLAACKLNAAEIEVGHVGNFVSSLFSGQAHLGGFFGHVDPAMHYMPASAHEAACASGSMAILAAMADLEAGRYETACVLGIEIMRNVSGDQAAANLRPAAWASQEWTETDFVWPCAFNNMLSLYEERYSLNKDYLYAISKQNFASARLNPNAQTRQWQFNEDSFSNNESANPIVSGDIRKQDCGQITDGAAVVFLATERKAAQYAARHNIALSAIPTINGWGHVNAPISFKEKLRLSEPEGFLFPHINALFQQTLKRARMNSLSSIDGLEVHDCFNITEYMILDHSGLYPPGDAWKAIENGDISRSGKLPVNISGGLMGLGHPVGATGVRMLLDSYKQISGSAGDYQIDNAQNVMTFNLGGSATTCASFIVGKAHT
ncbi:acetyl-CoA acetyltransferase [Zhongshania borealis]|uniref:Acetyl-CoA acetyltransferase n=1 Tax=Zhongshania borealis TaxID=889488 RepID=A0ABP7WJI4_9GAMM